MRESDDITTTKQYSQDILLTKQEENLEDSLTIQKNDLLISSNKITENRFNRVYDTEKNKLFLKDVAEREMLAQAEERAHGEPVKQFKMKNKGFKGIKQRRADTVSANNIIRQHNNNTDINYRSYRIMNGWSSRDNIIINDDMQTQINTAAMAAQSWKLSWNMLRPNVLADCVLKVRTFYKQAKLLSTTMADPQYAEYYVNMPRDRYRLLTQIVRTAEPLMNATEITFSNMGLSLDENGGMVYKNNRLTDQERSDNEHRLEEMKCDFTTQRNLLRRMDRASIRHYSNMSKGTDTSLLPDKYQSEDTKAAQIIDNAERYGAMEKLDEMFSGQGSLSPEFCKEYSGLMNKIMERDDFTFDEQGIQKFYEMYEKHLDWQMEYNTHSSYFKRFQMKSKLLKSNKERFDMFILPQFKKVFSLVNKGVIGKDTAKLFLSSSAIAYQIKNYETELYSKFAKRQNPIEADELSDNIYKKGVIDLVNQLKNDQEYIDMQKGNKTLFHDNYTYIDDESEIVKRKSFIRFTAKKNDDESAGSKGDDDESASDTRVYVTVKEDKQNEMLNALSDLMKENKKFRGKFSFKLMNTSNDHRRDNIVMYLSSKETDPELLKEFLDILHEKIKDYTSDEDEDNIPTINKLKNGIGVSPEPKDAFKHIYRMQMGCNPLDYSTTGYRVDEEILYNRLVGRKKKKDSPTYVYETIHKNVEICNRSIKSSFNITDDVELNKGTAQLSWNQYMTRLLILSAHVARHRLNRGENDKSVSNDAEVKKEMKQVFQEFLILSDINPNTMLLKSSDKFYNVIKG